MNQTNRGVKIPKRTLSLIADKDLRRDITSLIKPLLSKPGEAGLDFVVCLLAATERDARAYNVRSFFFLGCEAVISVCTRTYTYSLFRGFPWSSPSALCDYPPLRVHIHTSHSSRCVRRRVEGEDRLRYPCSTKTRISRVGWSQVSKAYDERGVGKSNDDWRWLTNNPRAHQQHWISRKC